MFKGLKDALNNIGQFLVGPYSRQRLEATMRSLEVELDFYQRQRTGSCYVQSAVRFYNEAKKSLAQNRIDEGWKLVQATDRELIKCLKKNSAELLLKAKQLRLEADEKLNNWRKNAVQAALPDDKLMKSEVDPNWVAEAHRILYEHFNNDYQRIKIVRDQLIVLFIVLFIDLILIVSFGEESIIPLLSASIGVPEVSPISLPNQLSQAGILNGRSEMIGVLLLGGLGGALTAILATARTGLRGRIPELIDNRLFTAFRPLLGASSALVVVLFVHSGESINLFNIHEAAIPGIAVAAGFSETLLSSVIASVSNRGS
jgi:hypothetical protein